MVTGYGSNTFGGGSPPNRDSLKSIEIDLDSLDGEDDALDSGDDIDDVVAIDEESA